MKAKGKYMKGDLARMARYHGAPVVPLKDPRAMFETLAAQRYREAMGRFRRFGFLNGHGASPARPRMPGW